MACYRKVLVVKMLSLLYNRLLITLFVVVALYFLSALDASKAFDRISHAKLFNKLVARNAPCCLIDFLIDWYSKLYSCVRWNSTLSKYFVVKLGVRQGGILSPFLFNVYVDDLLHNLESCGAGCYINGHYLGCVMYADDLLLLSASVAGLQHMLNICHTFGLNNSISFYHSKTISMKVGPSLAEANQPAVSRH